MSIVYNGKVVVLTEWHLWRPWIPIRLTEDYDMGVRMNTGPWRHIILVERRVGNPETWDRDGMEWEFRDIGERWLNAAELMMRPGGDGLVCA